MKLHSLVLALSLVALVACSKDMVTSPTPATPAAPVAPIAKSTTVSVLSQKTGETTMVTLVAHGADALPLPPSCEWRDQVIALHISLGGARSDVVTLANQHQVFIQDTGYGAGYRLVDYPKDWCIR